MNIMLHNMVNLKSEGFACFWTTLFMVATSLYETFDPKNKDHIRQRRAVEAYVKTTFKVLPCATCRTYSRDVLLKTVPMDYSGRRNLLYSMYLLKDAVNQKLIRQGNKRTKPSPTFESVYRRYSRMIVKKK